MTPTNFLMLNFRTKKGYLSSLMHVQKLMISFIFLSDKSNKKMFNYQLISKKYEIYISEGPKLYLCILESSRISLQFADVMSG